MRWLVAFGQFWWDFIVGDSLVLAVCGPAVLLIGYLLLESAGSTVAEIALPVLVSATLAASVFKHS